MKIAIFHNLPSGGAKRALYNIAKFAHKKRYEINLYIPDTANESYASLKAFTDKVNIFPVNKNIINLTSTAIKYRILPILFKTEWIQGLIGLEKTQKLIAEAINRSSSDIVIVEQDRFTFSPFLLKYIEKPHIYYCPQPIRYPHEIILQKLYKPDKYTSVKTLKHFLRLIVWKKLAYIDKLNASFAKFILTNSYFTKETILRIYGLNAFVSYLGVDRDVFLPMHISKENMVLSVGAITPAKGFDFLIRSIGKIKLKLRPKFIIISNKINIFEQKRLEKLALLKKVNLKIKFMVSDEELVYYYNKAKLFIYAPYLEPFGLAPLEAMACGTPVVAVKEGGVRESVLHGETGILTERDEDTFAAALSLLLEDESIRNRMSKKAIDLINYFWSLEVAGRRLFNYVTKAIQHF